MIQELAVVAAAAYPAGAEASTFHGVALNHVAIRVTNVQRSRDFYQKDFRSPVLHEWQSDCFLGLGKNFLTLFQNSKPGLDHFCIAIENFSADGALEELKLQEFNPAFPPFSPPRRPSATAAGFFPSAVAA